MSLKSGWIIPNGKFIECAYYCHIASVGQHPELESLVPEYSRWLDELAMMESEAEDRIAEDEHPSWHCYEMAADDVRYDIRKTLLDAGCLRVGSRGDQVYLEGKPDATTMQAAKDLAEEYGLEAVFEGPTC